MDKKILSESELKTISLVNDDDMKQRLIEDFTSKKFLTVDDFCNKLETLKAFLTQKQNMKNRNYYGEK